MKLICPNCGRQYESGTFCPECGTQLQEVVPEKVCPNCGYKASSGRFCPECGTEMVEKLVSAEPAKSVKTESPRTDERNPCFAKYYDNHGFPREFPKEEFSVVEEELTLFVNQHIPEAQMLLGQGLIALGAKDNDGAKIEKGVNLLKEAEAGGNRFAYYYLGFNYILGQQNHDEGEKRMLAYYNEYPNGDAAQALANLYAFSEDKCDYKKAFKYATIAAEDDKSDGYFVLGALYLNGWGVEKNIAAAIDNYKMAAADGDAVAMNQIGYIYMGNEGNEADPEQSFYWFNESAKKDSNVGWFNLGCCYKNGFGVKKDSEEAAECFKKAANLGYVDAMVELGDYYQGVLVDLKKAKSWYQAAAEEGHPVAQNKLGVLYANEDQPDYQEAIKWYKKAMKQDNAWAYYNFSCLLWEGKGTAENKEKAIKMMKKSIALGNTAAKEQLDEMLHPKPAEEEMPDTQVTASSVSSQPLPRVMLQADPVTSEGVRPSQPEGFGEEDELSFLMKIVSFFFPFVGFFYWLLKKSDSPLKAKSALKWAAAGFAVSIFYSMME